ncbi:methionine ABC transporter substrate-binding lipoprotein MetQ [Oceanimonas baumannii]|uniref:Lipoprotein n=1 Tax=Oceanimonas baumannii TaxID=129578 RepID=A0A235C9D9_9GAMM|nr:methionine ABC transporter substrate-binding lipoprotein MetQ [Oceanimonas baumannii]OYD21251.1 methionine ABC transporter substrate-binding protein MetQ [Oceanimonas baumannii]TDW55369.1 D-methionine transport system substrate-binding protein [Oceanimonas baumannii]
MKAGLKSFAGLGLLASALALAGCGEQATQTTTEAEAAKPLRLGVIAGAEEQVAEVAAKVAKEQYGLEVELVSFSDYVTPNVALSDGSLDINAFQHKPYLDKQIADRGYELVPVGNTFVYPIAGYSRVIESLDELADGAKVAVPNDPTNLGRSLLLLEQQGLIEVDDAVGLEATPLNITANPKNLDIIELEAPQLPRSLDDVAFAIINTTYASQIDMLPGRDSLFVEDKESPYVNLIVSRKDNQNDEQVQTFVKAYQSEEVYQAALELFKGGVVKGW